MYVPMQLNCNRDYIFVINAIIMLNEALHLLKESDSQWSGRGG